MPSDDPASKQSNSQNPPKFPPVVEDVLPPMPQKTDAVDLTPATINTNSGSAAPISDIQEPQVIGMPQSPKKKFVGGKVIATILGLFLLIGGVGAGIILTGQNQDVREEASTNNFQAPCTASGCTASDYPTHWVNHYRCLEVKQPGQGCSDIEVATGVRSASFQFNCGTEQIDHSGNVGFTTIYHDQDCSSTIQCVDAIVLYTKEGTMITDLNTLKAGQEVYLTIPIAYGANGQWQFSKARFTVNGVLRPEVTAHKKFQVADVYYDLYTVTSGTTNVQAEVYMAGSWYGK